MLGDPCSFDCGDGEMGKTIACQGMHTTAWCCCKDDNAYIPTHSNKGHEGFAMDVVKGVGLNLSGLSH